MLVRETDETNHFEDGVCSVMEDENYMIDYEVVVECDSVVMAALFGYYDAQCGWAR